MESTSSSTVVGAVGLNVVKDIALDRGELSGGMAKRVGIARALALNPALIFHDEPTSGLDPHLARQVQDLIMSAHSRSRTGEPRTTVLVTHDKDLLYRLRPRVIMLHDGRIALVGTYEFFQRSDLPVVRPYFELMPGLHQRIHV